MKDHISTQVENRIRCPEKEENIEYDYIEFCLMGRTYLKKYIRVSSRRLNLGNSFLPSFFITTDHVNCGPSEEHNKIR